MADRLNTGSVPVTLAALRTSAWLLFAVTSGSVAAQTSLADPTRPPVGVYVPAGDSVTATGPVLQSVMIPKKGRPVAIIGGQQVRLGEMFGENRLVKLNEREAVLEGPDGVERLWLTPGIEKSKVAVKNTNKPPSTRHVQGEGKP